MDQSVESFHNVRMKLVTAVQILFINFSLISCAMPQTEDHLAKARAMFPNHAVVPLCHAATYSIGNVVYFWNVNDFDSVNVTGTYAAILAQANGYDCNVGVRTADEIICYKATFPTSDHRALTWVGTDPKYYKNPEHLAFNKRSIQAVKDRNLTCDVGTYFEPAKRP